MGKARKQRDLAIGSAEAAAILRVHFTQPGKMAAKGLIAQTPLESAWSESPQHCGAAYSYTSCTKNWQEYLDAADGRVIGRPRANDQYTAEVEKHLRSCEQILFDDAVGIGQAAEILDVHPTMVNAWMNEGRIIHRFPWSHRGVGSRRHGAILSRSSVESLRDELIALERRGQKKGVKKRLT